MNNSVFCLYSHKSDINCKLFFNVIFVLHYLNEKILSYTGFFRTQVFHLNNILNSPMTNNRQKLQVQFAFPNHLIFNNQDLTSAKTSFQYRTPVKMRLNNQPNINHCFTIISIINY